MGVVNVSDRLRIEPRYDMPSYLWPRPRYRGVLHAVGALLILPLGVILVFSAADGEARIAASAFAVAQFTVFATSATYHRVAKSPTVRRRMQIADHSMIFLLIAGTWVPVCLLAMPASRGRLFLAGVALAAITGIVLKLFGIDRFPKSANAMYGVMGWAGVLALPTIIENMDGPALAMLAIGGLVYSLGAMVLMFKHPDPRPSEFGYHEIWHTCTVLGAACHFVMVWMVAV